MMFNDCVEKAKMLEQIKQDAEDINPRTKTSFGTFKVNYEKPNSATNYSKVSSRYIRVH